MPKKNLHSLDGVARTLLAPLACRAIESIRPDGGGYIVVIDFSNPGGAMPGLLEQLGKRHHIGNLLPEVSIQIIDLDLIGTKPRHDRGPGRVAQGNLVVGMVEENPTGGEPVDVGRPRHGIAIATQGRGQIIHRDEQDIALR